MKSNKGQQNKTLVELWQYVENVKPEIERALREHLPLAPAFIATGFNRAVEYSLFPGGKRLRPVLTLLGAEIVGGGREQTLAAAAAIEYVHTSSLIFDDLPCMDDAAERRGKTALHTAFGEGTAVLVGLALLNASYGLVFTGANGNGNSERAIRAHCELVECIGAGGMVGGQSIDLALADTANGNNNFISDAHRFESVRNLKTSALMRMALRVGATLAGADQKQLETLTRFADLMGDAYQTSDDLLDLTEDLHISETNDRRATFAAQQGIERARNRVAALVGESKSILRNEFGATRPAELLAALADYIVTRKD